MIVGVGTDLCEIARVRDINQRRGGRFARKVLGDAEWAAYEARRQTSEARASAYLALRFAGKEAFAKAIGLGLRLPMRLQDCEILSEASGKPHLQLHGELAQWFAARGWRAHISLSDEAGMALAFAVVERG